MLSWDWVFHFGGYRGSLEYGIPDPDYPTEMRNERGRRVREFLRDEGEVFGYEYDFGDGWEQGHNPKVPGSNPGPATKTNKGVTAHSRSPFSMYIQIGRYRIVTFSLRLTFLSWMCYILHIM